MHGLKRTAFPTVTNRPEPKPEREPAPVLASVIAVPFGAEPKPAPAPVIVADLEPVGSIPEPVPVSTSVDKPEPEPAPRPPREPGTWVHGEPITACSRCGHLYVGRMRLWRGKTACRACYEKSQAARV